MTKHGVRIDLALVALAMVAFGCSTSPTRASRVAGPGGIQVPVTRVTDGDTVRVTYEGREERVRLIGIDTPEVPWYGGQAECFGVEAGLYARSRLSGGSVRLVFDRDRRDRYGRLLAYLYLSDELFNLTLVRLGYARADPVPPNTHVADRFARAEAEAREAGRGLWSACPLGGDG